jgi:hypothetical protein
MTKVIRESFDSIELKNCNSWRGIKSNTKAVMISLKSSTLSSSKQNIKLETDRCMKDLMTSFSLITFAERPTKRETNTMIL